MHHNFIFINEFSRHVSIDGNCSLTDIFPYNYLAWYCAWNKNLKLLTSTKSSHSVTVFIMHLKLFSYYVVFQNFTTPKASEEKVLTPKWTNGKVI